MKFYAPTQLGTKRRLTNEGFLVVEDVPIARIGEMIYGPGEVPITPGADGLIRVERSPEQVFRLETIASASGKPIVDDHPPEDVTPKNWRQLAGGMMLNPRRGEGDQSDLLLADLMVTDADMMQSIRDGKIEVSCGYDAEYDELAPGVGRQHTIVINHLALVDRGRCGPRCSIGDHKHPDQGKEPSMARTADKRRSKVSDFIRRAFKAKDAENLEEIISEAESEVGDEADPSLSIKPKDNEVHLHLGGAQDDEVPAGGGGMDPDTNSRFERLEAGFDELSASMKGIQDSFDAFAKKTGDEPAERTEMAERIKAEEERGKKDQKDEAILGQLEMEAPPGTSDAARKARDSVYLADSFQETVARVEIIAPGMRVPTFDRKEAPTKTFDAICNMRRQAIDLAYTQPKTRAMIEEIAGNRRLDVSKMTCDAVRTMFNAAVAATKAINNAGGGSPMIGTSAAVGAKGKIASLADINKAWSTMHKPAA